MSPNSGGGMCPNSLFPDAMGKPVENNWGRILSQKYFLKDGKAQTKLFVGDYFGSTQSFINFMKDKFRRVGIIG